MSFLPRYVPRHRMCSTLKHLCSLTHLLILHRSRISLIVFLRVKIAFPLPLFLPLINLAVPFHLALPCLSIHPCARTFPRSNILMGRIRAGWQGSRRIASWDRSTSYPSRSYMRRFQILRHGQNMKARTEIHTRSRTLWAPSILYFLLRR
ncbi:hypothetical protein BKA70DRAFT_1334597 [Coprinopsis sp. MPI-PUGE-AT-0042]|nr:hypothetical protein BKA70DRAFT_1334597 [Coprinopsis sp. MPI-PUGE-AT-0042]